VFSCDSQGVVGFLVRPVHQHRVRQAVEVAGYTKLMPCQAAFACYLRCSGMRGLVVGVAKRVGWCLCSISCSLSPPFFYASFSVCESYMRHSSYIPGRFTNPDLMILRHVATLGCPSDLKSPGDRQDRNNYKPTPPRTRSLHGICRRYPWIACLL
jgi:hypothetical protein